jgi:hypothetical protein
MGVEMKFDFRDVFRAGRIGFSAKKIFTHFFGIALAYIIYELIFYITLLIADPASAGDFWAKFGLGVVWPWSDVGVLALPLATKIGMWIGLLIAFIIFFTTSLMVSKITIEQLRGDEFYSMKDSAKFAKEKWTTLFLAFVSVILIIIFCMLWPLGAALLALIPKGVGDFFLMLATFIFIPAFFLGLAVAYSAVVVVVSLFFAPSITAVEGSDSFEVIYQEYRLLWGQPWRMLVYQILLGITKAICGGIYAVMSGAGFGLVLLLPALIVHDKYATVMSRTFSWLGMSDGPIAKALNLTEPTGGSVMLNWIGAILTTIALLFVIGMIVSYVASIASVGNTMIYVILRKRHDDENLLEREEEEEEEIPGLKTEEEKPEEEKKEEEAEEEQKPEEEKAEEKEEESKE